MGMPSSLKPLCDKAAVKSGTPLGHAGEGRCFVSETLQQTIERGLAGEIRHRANGFSGIAAVRWRGH